jgi:hypothetical protein
MVTPVMVAFDGELARTETSAGAWHFVLLPLELSEEIHDLTAGFTRGFRSLRVDVRLGGSQWRTSIFPSREGPYLLPVKKAVRDAEGVEEGDEVEVALELVDL